MSIPAASVTPIDRHLPVAAYSQGAVSWPAVFAGAVGAAALSLILLVLGTGLGLSTVSPWSGKGLGATAFTTSTILWLTFTQLAASGIGGYLAGRLRTRWVTLQSDEVYFRDTAHGFLAWAVASLATAALLGSVIGSLAQGAAQATATVAGGAAAATADKAPALAAPADRNAYFVDTLFRKDGTSTATADPSSPNASAEAARIFAAALASGALPEDDKRYLAQVVSQRTGLTPADADRRVTDGFTRLQTQARNAETTAREAADKARKATAYGSLWLAASLFIGAFVASLSATFGGRRRDL